VACVSDVHSPKYLGLFKDALRKIDNNKVDLFLFAGDIIYKGKVDELKTIISVLEDFHIKFPIYACFGNEEYDNLYEELKEIGKDKIIFLEDELVFLHKAGLTVGIIGTKGSLAEPTWWQQKNFPEIKEIYKKRVKIIEDLAGKLNTDIRILLLHYAPTYSTVIGEPIRAHPQIGDPAFEKIILNQKFKIDVVFHGHAHRGRKFSLLKNMVPIYNVAFPLRKEITVVNLPRPPSHGSLLNYLK